MSMLSEVYQLCLLRRTWEGMELETADSTVDPTIAVCSLPFWAVEQAFRIIDSANHVHPMWELSQNPVLACLSTLHWSILPHGLL